MKPTTALRWIAHVWGVLSTLTLLAFALGGNESLRMTAGEAVGFLCFPIGLIVGFVVAWWREGVGGLISVASLGLFYAWHASRTGVWPSGPYFLLFAAPGFLHITSSLLARRRSRQSAAHESTPRRAALAQTRRDDGITSDDRCCITNDSS